MTFVQIPNIIDTPTEIIDALGLSGLGAGNVIFGTSATSLGVNNNLTWDNTNNTFLVKAMAGQTLNIFETKNSAGTVLTHIANDGTLKLMQSTSITGASNQYKIYWNTAYNQPSFASHLSGTEMLFSFFSSSTIYNNGVPIMSGGGGRLAAGAFMTVTDALYLRGDGNPRLKMIRDSDVNHAYYMAEAAYTALFSKKFLDLRVEDNDEGMTFSATMTDAYDIAFRFNGGCAFTGGGYLYVPLGFQAIFSSDMNSARTISMFQDNADYSLVFANILDGYDRSYFKFMPRNNGGDPGYFKINLEDALGNSYARFVIDPVNHFYDLRLDYEVDKEPYVFRETIYYDDTSPLYTMRMETGVCQFYSRNTLNTYPYSFLFSDDYGATSTVIIKMENSEGVVDFIDFYGYSKIDNKGAFQPPTIDDASAHDNSIYYSNDQAKLVYKDSGGTIHDLY